MLNASLLLLTCLAVPPAAPTAPDELAADERFDEDREAMEDAPTKPSTDVTTETEAEGAPPTFTEHLQFGMATRLGWGGTTDPVLIDRSNGEEVEWVSFYENVGRDDLATSYRWRWWLRAGALATLIGALMVSSVHVAIASAGLASYVVPALQPVHHLMNSDTGMALLIGSNLLNLAFGSAAGLVLAFVDPQPASRDEILGLMPAYAPTE